MADELTPSDIAVLRGKLLAMRTEILSRARQAIADVDEAQWTPDRGDPQDRAAAERLRQAVAAVSERDARMLAEIDAALSRMTDGTYGICEDTGEPIPRKRLYAVPTARRTAEAEALAEAEAQAERATVESGDDPYAGY